VNEKLYKRKKIECTKLGNVNRSIFVRNKFIPCLALVFFLFDNFFFSIRRL